MSIKIPAFVREGEISLSVAEIKDLFTNPKVLVEAPGAGKAIEMLTCAIDYSFVGPAYATEANLIVHQLGAGASYFEYALLADVASSFGRMNGILDTPGDTIITEDTDAVISAEGADPTAGNSTAIVYFTYRIINL